MLLPSAIATTGRPHQVSNDQLLLEEIVQPLAGPAHSRRIASRLLERWGSLDRVIHADSAMLREFGDLSDELELRFSIIVAAAKRLSFVAHDAANGAFGSVIRRAHLELAHKPHEECIAFFFDRKMELILVQNVGIGTIDFVQIHPRELARRCLDLDARYVVLAHNHPSGDPTPSDADWSMTLLLDSALQSIGVELLDHAIVGSRDAHNMFGFLTNTITQGDIDLESQK